MKHRLHPHEQIPAGPALDLTAECTREGAATLGVAFVLLGPSDAIRWPGDRSAGAENWQRADELWQHTCFEAFVRPAAGEEYVETNFATSAEWAAYRFAGYRSGMTQENGVSIAAARWRIGGSQAEVDLTLCLPRRFENVEWSVGLSAVIEPRRGPKSYWALAHPPGQPDFHHPDCFALRLPPRDEG